MVVHRTDADPPTADDLHRHAAATLSYFAVPTRWEIRTAALPTLAGEKVDKKTLAREFGA